MTLEDGKEYEHRRRNRYLIPAGLFIGLGVGMLLGYPGPGLLIGMGLGFIGSTLMTPAVYAAGDAAAVERNHGSGHRLIMALLGIFFVVLGLSIIWTPPNFWPYFGAGFMIILGVWFIAKSLGKA
jgi:hypothetical protein